MALTPGARLGPYEILSALGVGGMGEVYRARDSSLGRDVAVKVLPSSFAADPDRLRRFEREARLLATLNHPHIATIHGFEEAAVSTHSASSGSTVSGIERSTDSGQVTVRALVMELIEGPTLAEKLAEGSRLRTKAGLPLTEALRIAGQIVAALEAAHEKGVIHRDLKPANIKFTRDGNVKVLDFGLAKAFAGDESGPDLSQLPTVTATELRPGAIVGTPAYMSPEQARGQAIDKRTDIWAFGCVFYEALTGRNAFSGATLTDTLAAILEREPDWGALPHDTPANVCRLLQRCLDKDPKRRLRDIGDARFEIEDALAAIVSLGAVKTAQKPPSRDRVVRGTRPARRAWWAAAAAGLLVIGGVVLWWQLQRSGYFWRNPLEGAKFTRLTDFEGAEHHAAISRDGKFVVFLSDRDGAWDAWAGQVGTGDFHNLTKGSVSELRNPAVRTVGFSPDGSLVSVWNRMVDPAKGALVDGGWVVPTMGGQLRPYLPGVAELDWSPDGRRIVYHPSAPGDPTFVTEADEKSGRQIYAARPGVHNHFPVWSPDGAYIYFVQGFPLDEMDVWRIRPTGGEPERVTFHNARVSFPTFLDSRTLLYLATADDGSGPWIHALDVERRVSRRISTGVDEYTSLAASADGRRLVVTASGSTAGLWRAVVADRVISESGAARIAVPTARGLSPRMGPGYILYRAPRAGTDGLWRLAEGTATELWSGLDGRVGGGPAIAPDGRRIAFPVQRRGLTRLHIMNADGAGGGARPVAEELDVRGAPAWSPDGQWITIAANQGGEPRLFNIPAGGGAPVPLVKEYSIDPIWSPTGRFVVYSGADIGTTFPVKAVNADGTPHDLPKLILSRGARRLGFLAGEDALVVLKGDISHKEFWVVDLRTGRERQLTDFRRGFTIGDFDVSADGREIVFDRAREESDIVLIDLAAR